MTKSQRAIQLAAQLYEARDIMRTLLGDKFQARMKEYGEAITEVMAAKSVDTITAAQMLCKETESPMQQITILAAAVEMAEPSEVPA